MAVGLDSFYKVVGGEYRCQVCEYTSPHREKARRHAWSRHGVELEAEVVEVVYPEKVLTPEENAVVVKVRPMKKSNRVEVADKFENLGGK
jgi:hypothetical protein